MSSGRKRESRLSRVPKAGQHLREHVRNGTPTCIAHLFITRTGRRLSRREAAALMRRIAVQANARLSEDERIAVSPHVLRHTFLRKLAKAKSVHYAREASGYQSDRYIWRYVKPDQQTLADAIDELE
jgi:integrase/recombinase XerD